MKESEIEKRLVNKVKDDGGLALKLVSASNNGYPDRLVLIAIGHIAFVEVKVKGAKPRALQIKRHKKLRDLGFKVYILDDEKDIGGIINDIRSA